MNSDVIISRPIRTQTMTDSEWQLRLEKYQRQLFPYSRECNQCGQTFRFGTEVAMVIPPSYCRDPNCIPFRIMK
jgi:hypothetical protein